LYHIKQLSSQVQQVNYRIKELEEKLNDKFDTTNEKTFHEVFNLIFNLILVYNLF
jgi:hypothetical protein